MNFGGIHFYLRWIFNDNFLISVLFLIHANLDEHARPESYVWCWRPISAAVLNGGKEAKPDPGHAKNHEGI